jgi:hypothetical protein
MRNISDMPRQKVEESGFLCLAYNSRGLAMVLANKNNPATPGTCKGGDAIALDMSLEDFSNEDNAVFFSAPLLAIDPEDFEANPVVTVL